MTERDFDVRGLFQMFWPRPASTPEELLLLGLSGDSFDFKLARWTPAAGSTELRHDTQESLHFILSATSDAALVEGDEIADGVFNETVVATRGELSATVLTVAGVEDELPFVLLNPRYLYNINDLRFYSSKPSLQKTPLPAKLADLEGRSRFHPDHHVLRLR